MIRRVSAMAMILVSMVLPSSAATSGNPELPIWSAKERKELEATGWVAGSFLLTDERIPGEPEPPAAAAIEVDPPTAEEMAEPVAQTTDIPDKFLATYFAEQPKSFLIDPQGLLSTADYRDRLAFLNYHASDSSIDLFVYLVGGDQEIPSEVREEELMERFFRDGRPAAVVFYFLGAPQRSFLRLSPGLTAAVPAADQKQVLASSLMQAFAKANPTEQLEAFLVQMSIRIYWMERALGTAPEMMDGLASLAKSTEVAKPTSGRSKKLEWALGLVEKYQHPAAISFGAFWVVGCAIGVMRRRARYDFPDFDVEPRLGGAHAAGVGAVISFASAAVPPASQRDQVPDYLRRA